MPTKQTASPIYQAYLVHFWRDNPRSPWRVAQQNAVTEEVRHFATLDAYWSFLQSCLAVASDDLSTPPMGAGADHGNSPGKEV